MKKFPVAAALLLFFFAAANLVFAEKISTDAATRLVERVFPSASGKIIFETIPDIPPTEKIVCEIENAKGGKIVIRGNSTVALTSGFYQYFKEFCGGQIAWGARNVPVLDRGTPLPRVPEKIRFESALTLRFAYNFCTHGYTTAWWDWPRWEREIDRLALHGFNVALVVAGEEAVLQNTFARFGFTREEIRARLSAPSHFPWLLLGNAQALFPPPQSTIAARARLGRLIVARMRELGIEPALQGFYGIVPDNFQEKFAGARVVPQGAWVGGITRPALLDPADPLFAPLANAFYEEQRKIFGNCRFFAADPFHEGGNGKTAAERGNAFKKIQETMLAFEPSGTLVKQCWQTSNAEMFAAAQKNRVLALDLYCDNAPFWRRGNGFGDTPWLWCLLLNFGGNTGMEGDLRKIFNEVRAATETTTGTPPAGIGLVPEGILGDPIVFELFSDIAVRGTAAESVEARLAACMRSRYGKSSPALDRARKILLETAYSCATQQGPINSALPARPRFGEKIKARTWAPDEPPSYSCAALCEALKLFASEQENFGEIETFRYDCAELRRQLAANLSCLVHAKLNAAWNARDKVAFGDAARDFMRLFEISAARFAAFPQHADDDVKFSQSLAKLLDDAGKFGTTPEEKFYLKKSAATLLTTWVPDAGTDLEDYAFREWTGLLETYYAPRWLLFFSAVNEAFEAGTEFDDDAFGARLGAFERAWLDAVGNGVPANDGFSARKIEIAAKADAELEALVKKYEGATAISAGTANTN